MVSPPRKKKADRRTRTGPSTSTATPAGSQRLRFPSKPLTNKRFYLDIKNHAALKKLGDRVNSLGGKLELFLVKEVDYVVTDRDASTFTKRQPLDQVPTPSPLPSFCSVSPATTDSPTDGLGNRKTRSRAEAMLERVKQQPLKTTGDILNNALAWKIPIYPLSKFLNWLEKISSKTSQVCRDQNSSLISSQGRGLKVLTGTYLKIETGFRPEFKQFTSWPALGFLSSRATSSTANRAKPPTVTVLAQSSANCGNFERDDQTGPTANKDLMSNEPSQRMTRKVGRTGKEASSAIGGGNGYCEICRIHYDQLDSHTISAQHLKLVTDSAQYSQLDSIIQQNNLGSNSLRKSLRIAKSPPPFLPPEMGGKHSSGGTGGMVDSGSVGKDYTKTLRLKECSVSLGPPSPLLNGHTTVTLKTSRSGKLSSPALMPAAAMNGCSRRSQRSQPMQESSDREGVDALNLTPVGDHNLRSRKASSAQTPMTPPPPERLPSPPPEKLSSSHLRSGTLSEKAMTRSDRSRRSEDRGPSTRSSVERVPPQKIQPERATTVTSRRFRERSVDSEQAAKTPSKSSERPSRHHSRHKTRIKEEKSDDDDSKKPRKQDEDPVEDEERAERRRKRDERTDQDDKSRSSDKDKWCTSHDRIPKSDRSLRVRERTYYEDTESEESPAFPTKTVRSSKMKKRASSKSRVTKKRLSVEEKFIEDNKSYYKVEVLNSKLRSTEYFVNQRQAEERVNGESASDEVKPVVVRFKKIRTTEVALLSDEAESFMFGEPKKQGSEDEGVDRSQDEACSELGRVKDETSERSSEKNSSVRTDSDMIAVKPPSTDSIAVSIKEEDPEEDEEPIEEDLSKMTFSFEKPPTKEPWLEALLRQREGTEFYIPMFHEYPKVVLPYQVKRQWRKPGRKPGTSTSLVAATPTSAVVTTPAAVATPSSPFHRKDRVSRLIQASVDDKPRKSPRNLNAVRRGVSTSGSVPALTSDNISLKPEDISNEPGERCHASTLAIMSSLMRRRPMRECAEKPVSYEEESSLPETVESSGSNSNSMDVKAQTPSEPPRVPPSNDFDAPFSDDKIAEALLNGVTHLDDYEPATCFQVDPDCLKDDVPVYSKPGLNMPVEEILATYPSCNSMNIEENLSILRTFPGFYRGQADSCASSDCSDFLGFMEDGQAATKKRKKRRNLTGWPIEKPKKKRDKDLGGSCLLLNSRPVTPEPARLTSAAATPRSACSNKKRGRPGKARPCLSAALPIPSDPAATSSPPPSSPFSEYSDLPIKKKIARFGTRRSIFK